MIVEIRKAGFVNKGAQLMLHSILEKMKKAYPDAIFTMAPTTRQGPAPFNELVHHGVHPKVQIYRYGMHLGDLAGCLPRKIREMYGLVLDREVDIVIDAAGFSYSDQWGTKSVRELAHSTRRWKRKGTKIILMPQAFGPFTGRRMRNYIREVLNRADLVMPRERASYGHLTALVGERNNIVQYPDFTNLLEGILPEVFDAEVHRVCLVPNYRMIDKTEEKVSKAYLPFLQYCAKHLLRRDAQPFILVHEGAKDRWLAEQVSNANGGVPILKVEDPREIKGILGASYATVGSRFHGLVSALSQGVPSLATGWSHKYQELFRDYAFPEGIIENIENEKHIESKVDMLLDGASNRSIRTRLSHESRKLKASSEEMWGKVFEIVNASTR